MRIQPRWRPAPVRRNIKTPPVTGVHLCRATGNDMAKDNIRRNDVLVLIPPPEKPLARGLVVQVIDRGRKLIGRYFPPYLVCRGFSRMKSILLSAFHYIQGVVLVRIRSGQPHHFFTAWHDRARLENSGGFEMA